MTSVSVLNCFRVLLNGIVTLIGSNLTIFDLTWNQVFPNCARFEITAIEWITIISHIVWGYFKVISSILNNFYEFEFLFDLNYDQNNWYEYQTHIIKAQLLILLSMYELK